MKKLTILVDLDSTAADLCTPWYRVYNKRFGDTLHIDNVTNWDTSQFAKHGMKVFAPLYDPGLYLNLEPLPGAVEVIKMLHEDGHRLVVVTAVPAGSMTGGYEKKQWVLEHLPFIDKRDVVVTDAKDIIRGDVLLDDGPHNIEAFRKNNPYAYIATIAYPYNTHAHKDCDLVAYDYRTPRVAWRQILDGVRTFADRLNPNHVKPLNVDADGRPVDTETP